MDGVRTEEANDIYFYFYCCKSDGGTETERKGFFYVLFTAGNI